MTIEETTNKSKRGGYRPNAKRPTLYKTGNMIRSTITLPPHHAAILSAIDPNNTSAAIRTILDDERIQKIIETIIKERK